MSQVLANFSLALSVLFLIVYRYINNVNIVSLSSMDARPVIFGEDFCGEVYHQKITITGTFLQKLIGLYSSKTILQGIMDDDNIMLKSLISAEEFERIDELFYNKFTDKVLQSKNAIDIVKLHILSSVRFKPGTVINHKFRLCPYSSNIEKMFKKLNTEKYLTQDYLHLWTILQANPEPLMLKLLPPPKWYTPKFYGSCGRLIAVEDCGYILTHYYLSAWIVRANFTYHLLNAAFQFTFGDPDFAYYLTDMSPDNIGITDEGRVKFIDLEHVIVVDKKPVIEASMSNWRYNHTSRHISCKDCIMFDSDEICMHRISDHNVYAVCKEILSDSTLLPGGLLHDIPRSFARLREFEDLIPDCVGALKRSRFETAKIMMTILKLYI